MAVENSPAPAADERRTHTYHAEAAALHGRLHLPLKQDIPTQSYLKLKEDGRYLSQDSDRYRLEGIVSYTSAYSQVAGNEETAKPGHGWATLATSVIENLNVLEIITADRVVAQVATEHPRKGYVPKIAFLGSRFENLRIAGQLIDVPIDPYVLWDEEESLEHGERDQKRLKRIADLDVAELHREEMPGDLPECYPALEPHPQADPVRHDRIHYSLVAPGKQDRDGWLGFLKKQPARHIFDVPHFGRIYLGVVCVEHREFVDGIPHQTRVKLSMIKLKLGCVAAGSASIATTRTNGGSHP
jgi:hypothetical protein